MDGGVPAFDVRRWHRQFLRAHLQDVLRDLQNPEPGPEEVWASLYGQARGNVEGDPTGLEAVFGGGERAPDQSATGRRWRRSVRTGASSVRSEEDEVAELIQQATNITDPRNPGGCVGCSDLLEQVATNKATCDSDEDCSFSLKNCVFDYDGSGYGRCKCTYSCTGMNCSHKVTNGTLQGACEASMGTPTFPVSTEPGEESGGWTLPPEEDWKSRGCIRNESDSRVLATECHGEGFPIDFYIIEAHDTVCGRSDDDNVLLGSQWFKLRFGLLGNGTITNAGPSGDFCKISEPCAVCGY